MRIIFGSLMYFSHNAANFSAWGLGWSVEGIWIQYIPGDRLGLGLGCESCISGGRWARCNSFVDGYGQVQVGVGPLDIGEIRDLPETGSRELSVLFLGTGCVDESAFDGWSPDPIVFPV